MKPPLPLYLFLILVLFVANAQADKGLVQIVTEPGDAKVFVDGKRKGSTPSEPGLTFAVALDAGEHLVEVTIPAAEPMERYASKEIFVADDTVQSVSLKLTSERSNITQAFRDRLKKRFPNPIEPKMVAIPAGSFMMGCLSNDDKCQDNQKPARKVQLSAFEMGQHEVTFDQWDACVAHGGCDHWPNDQGWGRGDRPVINVSWEDAQQYTNWLNQLSGKEYRLPTEAEWEYAARAGTSTPFSTGNCINTSQANYDGNYDYNDCGAKTGTYLKKTQPVGSYPANPWGLHDMHGNVWEWTCSEYNATLDQRVNQCKQEPGQYQSLRGGAWVGGPGYLAAGYRGRGSPGLRGNGYGFRVACSLPPER